MVVSHKAKKKQHAYVSSSLCDHYNELFAHTYSSRAIKNFKHLSLSCHKSYRLVYYGPGIFYYITDIPTLG